MPISSINGIAPASAGASNIGLTDFLQLLTTQLRSQNPLKPTDNGEFLAQMAQFTALEQTERLNQNTAQSLYVQTSNQIIGLIGKWVEITTANGVSIGQVKRLRYTEDGNPTLTVTVNSIDMNGILPSAVKAIAATSSGF